MFFVYLSMKQLPIFSGNSDNFIIKILFLQGSKLDIKHKKGCKTGNCYFNSIMKFVFFAWQE